MRALNLATGLATVNPEAPSCGCAGSSPPKSVQTRTPDPRLIVWGAQLDVRTIHRGLDGGELTETHVAGAKYATKGSEAADAARKCRPAGSTQPHERVAAL